MKRPDALLSFSLPGLGQLAQKRPAAALAFFFAFAILLSIARQFWMVPLLCVAAGLETLRFPLAQFPDKNLRRAYGFVAGLGFLSWMSLSASYFLPLRTQSSLAQDVERLREDYFNCRRIGAQSDAAALYCLKSGPSAGLVDPWGHSYELSLSDGFFLIRSLGPDGQSGTADDSLYRTFLKSSETP
ncbi:type II secretion system protein GspG [bacterium]|nr:type II secretion system protein GspG [bacterium]